MTSTASIHWLAPQLLSRIFEHAHDPKLPSTMTSAALVCRAWRQPAQRLLLATKSMVRFLPPEILAHIFNLAHDPYTPSTMCSAALVCQDWRDPAQRALFQDVVMPVCFDRSIYSQLDGSEESERVLQDVRQRFPHLDNPLPGKEELAQKWEEYRLGRLYKPIRVELQDREGSGFVHVEEDESLSPPGSLAIRSPELRWCAGTRHLTITRGRISVNAFQDPNLKDLESLTFKPNVISKQPSSRPSPVWPSNLRKLCGEPVHVKFLLESVRFQPHTRLEYLHLEILILLDPFEQHIAGLRPFVSGLTDCTISLPAAGHACPDLRPLFDILPVLSHFIIILKGFSDTSLNPQFLRSVVGTLPASIKRLTIERVDSGGWLGLDDALLSIPFKEIASLISNPVNLARLELPDVRRAELEGHAAAADVLAEYELKSIRVVCWEDLL